MKDTIRLIFFTIVELLIVIAIIAILSSLLLPAVNKAKNKGKAIVCSGNLRQIQITLENYLDSYQDRYPFAKDSIGSEYWFSYLMKFGGSEVRSGGNILKNSLFICPASDGRFSISGTYYNNNYAYNSYVCSTQGTAGGRFATRSNIKRPSSTSAIIDGYVQYNRVSTNPCYVQYYYNYFDTLDEYTLGPGFNVHNGYANVAWLDGHVTCQKRGAVVWRNIDYKEP